jgi:hypothetical protein
LDAAALIDKFVFEVNYRLDNSQVCALDGFGVLRTGANGTISFTYNPTAKGEVLDGGASERLAEIEAQRATTVTEEDPQIEDDDEGDVVIDIAPRRIAEQTIVAEPTATVEPNVAEPKIIEPKTAGRRTERRRNDSDYVKGLRYGKGHKVVTGREGVTSRVSNVSKFIIIFALVAATLAILAIAYGLYNDWRNHQYMYEGLYDEPSVYDDTSSAGQGVRNPDLDYITPNQN